MEDQSLRPGTYAITSVANGRRRLFQSERSASLVIETLQHYRREGKYLLHAYVVMPDHVHFLITPQGIALERAVGLIKGGSSHRIGSKFPVWQKGFQDHRCRDAHEFIARKEYILMNPVRAGYATEPRLFRFSSAYRGGEALSG